MTSPPDKLFRDGLEHLRKAAPASAWERIESGLDRKRSRSPWMKIAAGLLILIVTTAVILQFNQTENSIVTASTQSAPATMKHDSTIAAATEVAVGSRQSSVESSELNSIVERSRNNHLDGVKKNPPVVERTRAERSRSSRNEPGRNSLQSAVSSQQLAVGSLNSSTNNQEVITLDPSTIASLTEEVQESIEPGPLSQAAITNETSVTERASDAKRTNLTYTAEEVNAKYLKKESTPQATPEKKNTSGLQKVVDLALDFKNEGSVLGELREKKNELLSFNIPSNKRETNK